jgi:signal transduction histidine kinase
LSDSLTEGIFVGQPTAAASVGMARRYLRYLLMEDQVIKVLFVEDDEDDYVFIRELLSEVKQTKYLLEWAPTYEIALKIMAKTENQVCLVDYRLGIHDGLEILRSAEARNARVPIIFVTGQEDYHVDLKAMRSGAADYLVKSQLTAPLLDRSIRYAMDRWRSDEALRRSYAEIELRVKERTAELAAANAALKRSADEIKLFAYSITHDLKNPALVIHYLAKKLAETYEDALDDRGKEYCRRVVTSSEQIVALLEKIYAYVSAKESPLVVERVELGEVLTLLRDEFSSQLRLRQVKWSGPDMAPAIVADRLALIRILRNLVENALKYGGEGLSEIQIGYQDSGDEHVISVRDDGAGFKDMEAEKIFGLFVRSESSKGVEGTGLGLAIVKELAQQHKGRVWAELPEGRGATFFVSFPKNPLVST